MRRKFFEMDDCQSYQEDSAHKSWKEEFFLHYSDLEDQQRPGKSCDTGEKVSRG